MRTHTRAAFAAIIAALSIGLSAMRVSGVAAADEDPCRIETKERIVAVGDIHGAYDRFVSILREAKVIDTRDRWSGGRAILVQTGDVVDRGPDSRKALDLLRRLEREAERADGRVIALLGNHEVMWMLGDLRDASEGEYAAFRTDQSQDLRERLSRTLADQESRRQQGANKTFDADAFRKQFIDTTPLGSIELQIAFGPKGEYGTWLRTHHVAAVINGMVFLHGGISPSVAALGCAGINEQGRKELESLGTVALKSSADLLLTRDDGPLWYRGLAMEPESAFSASVDTIVTALNARTIVVGHTSPANGRITPRFGGRIVLIDTGMLGGKFFPGGRPSALEILGGAFTAIYQGERVEIPAASAVPKAAAF
jgi:predicted MPP superfamily phosphohydrolase